jgi:predicted transcriptional regulator
MARTLTDREADLMEVLWDRGPSTVAEVHAGLNAGLAYTTVLALLRTMENKGIVRRSKEGRAHRYVPAIERQKAQKAAVNSLAQKLFRGSVESLLLHVVSNEELSADAIARIQRLLDRHEKDR